MPLTIVPKREGRVLTMRPAAREGLYALASAWASSERGPRPLQASSAASTETPGAQQPAHPGSWPDGPSAA